MTPPEQKGGAPEEAREIEASIEELLGRLDNYDFESFSPEIQEAWYWAEQEAGVGRDRELARANLQKFLDTLQEQIDTEGK